MLYTKTMLYPIAQDKGDDGDDDEKEDGAQDENGNDGDDGDVEESEGNIPEGSAETVAVALSAPVEVTNAETMDGTA